MSAVRARKALIIAAVFMAVAGRSAWGDDAPPPAEAAPAPSAPPAPLAGSDYLHLASGSSVTTDGGTNLRLPPGYFLDEPAHAKLDAELKRSADAETRLTAENASLRAATSGWSPGWRTILIATATGFAGGIYAYHRFAN